MVQLVQGQAADLGVSGVFVEHVGEELGRDGDACDDQAVDIVGVHDEDVVGGRGVLLLRLLVLLLVRALRNAVEIHEQREKHVVADRTVLENTAEIRVERDGRDVPAVEGDDVGLASMQHAPVELRRLSLLRRLVLRLRLAVQLVVGVDDLLQQRRQHLEKVVHGMRGDVDRGVVRSSQQRQLLLLHLLFAASLCLQLRLRLRRQIRVRGRRGGRRQKATRLLRRGGRLARNGQAVGVVHGLLH